MSELKDYTYSRAMEELDSIVAKMQAPDCDIDLLAQYTSRALELMKFCKDKLHKTQKDVEECLKSLAETAQ